MMEELGVKYGDARHKVIKGTRRTINQHRTSVISHVVITQNWCQSHHTELVSVHRIDIISHTELMSSVTLSLHRIGASHITLMTSVTYN